MDFGQILATSHDLTSNGDLAREISLFQGTLGGCKNLIIIWPEWILLHSVTAIFVNGRVQEFMVK